jgi:hypothetical protein
MVTPQQTQDVDAKQIAERHLIEGYLAGRLSEADADALESLVATQPELAMQIEQVARMKVGLDILRRRGDLARLLQERPGSRYRAAWVAVAAAASLALVAFLALRPASPPVAMLASTLEGLADSRGAARKIAATYLLTSERAAAAPARIGVFDGEDEAIELRFDAAAAAGFPFTVEILRAEGGSLRSITRADAVPGSPDGNVVVYVAARALLPGDYLFRLTPASGEPSLEFAARVGGD